MYNKKYIEDYLNYLNMLCKITVLQTFFSEISVADLLN